VLRAKTRAELRTAQFGSVPPDSHHYSRSVNLFPNNKSHFTFSPTFRFRQCFHHFVPYSQSRRLSSGTKTVGVARDKKLYRDSDSEQIGRCHMAGDKKWGFDWYYEKLYGELPDVWPSTTTR
jgi:hypothetical protein